MFPRGEEHGQFKVDDMFLQNEAQILYGDQAKKVHNREVPHSSACHILFVDLLFFPISDCFIKPPGHARNCSLKSNLQHRHRTSCSQPAGKQLPSSEPFGARHAGRRCGDPLLVALNGRGAATYVAVVGNGGLGG